MLEPATRGQEGRREREVEVTGGTKVEREGEKDQSLQ